MNVQQQTSTTADLAAAASATLASTAWIADLNAILTIAATVVAICAGSAATWWHVDKIRAARRERRRYDEVLNNGSTKDT